MYVYIVIAANGLFKIGKSVDPDRRMAGVKSASPIECIGLAAIPCNGIDLEAHFHEQYAAKRVRGEWFALSKEDILSIIPTGSQPEAEIRAWIKDGVFDPIWEIQDRLAAVNWAI